MTRSLLIEFYLQNSHKFEYLGTGSTDSNDSSLIREPKIIEFRLFRYYDWRGLYDVVLSLNEPFNIP